MDFFSAFLIGLLGSAHCLGMCGGIAVTLSLSAGHSRPLPVLLAFNIGRLSSYLVAATLMATMLATLSDFADRSTVLRVMQTISGTILILLGFYLGRWNQWLLIIERQGQFIWRRLQPLASRLMPVKSLPAAFSLGAIWGWLPCGMIYSMLVWVSSSTDPVKAVSLMAAFGLGTLPSMLSSGIFAQQLRQKLNLPWVRHIAGAGLVLFGFWQLGRTWL